LAGGDILKWEAVTDLPNSDILLKYSMMGDKAIIEKRMNDIAKSKNNG